MTDIKNGSVVNIDTRNCEQVHYHFVEANVRFIRKCKRNDGYSDNYGIFIIKGDIEYLPLSCIVE